MSKMGAHHRRKQKDARDVLSRAESMTAVVAERYDGTPVTHVKEVVTFLEFGVPAYIGDEVRIRVVDVGPSWAKACVIVRLN